MTNTLQRQEILQSLNSLDSAESEKVLDYIKGLINVQRQQFYVKHLKRHRAMQEISQALREARRCNQPFKRS